MSASNDCRSIKQCCDAYIQWMFCCSSFTLFHSFVCVVVTSLIHSFEAHQKVWTGKKWRNWRRKQQNSVRKKWILSCIFDRKKNRSQVTVSYEQCINWWYKILDESISICVLYTFWLQWNTVRANLGTEKKCSADIKRN